MGRPLRLETPLTWARTEAVTVVAGPGAPEETPETRPVTTVLCVPVSGVPEEAVGVTPIILRPPVVIDHSGPDTGALPPRSRPFSPTPLRRLPERPLKTSK